MEGNGMTRREFLDRTVLTASTALSYGRIPGANDRLMLGHIGVGNRGRGLQWIVSQLAESA